QWSFKALEQATSTPTETPTATPTFTQVPGYSVNIQSTTPSISLPLTVGETYTISALAQCLVDNSGVGARFQASLWNNSGQFRVNPAQFLPSASTQQDLSTGFSSVFVENNGPVVLKARIWDNELTTLLGEDTETFQVVTPTPTLIPTVTPTSPPSRVERWATYE
ncbi:MAG TPA: hypothetical protein PKH07_16750, partial [bacterium]|nr:hypothetical protein [bacterium]